MKEWEQVNIWLVVREDDEGNIIEIYPGFMRKSDAIKKSIEWQWIDGDNVVVRQLNCFVDLGY